MIYVIKQKGLYQNEVNSSLVFTCNCKMATEITRLSCFGCELEKWRTFHSFQE